jgi:hypothetical protein
VNFAIGGRVITERQERILDDQFCDVLREQGNKSSDVTLAARILTSATLTKRM